MFSSSNTSVKLHLILIVCVAGVAYFMYQLYNECKDLERELLISKKQIAFLSSANTELVTVCPHEEVEEIIVDADETKKDDARSSSSGSGSEESIESDYELIGNGYEDSESDQESDEDSDEDEEEEEEAAVDEVTVDEVTVDDVKEVNEVKEVKINEVRDKAKDKVKEFIVEKVNGKGQLEKAKAINKMSKNSLNKLKISELKDYLSQCSKDSTGTKNELIERIVAL